MNQRFLGCSWRPGVPPPSCDGERTQGCFLRAWLGLSGRPLALRSFFHTPSLAISAWLDAACCYVLLELFLVLSNEVLTRVVLIAECVWSQLHLPPCWEPKPPIKFLFCHWENENKWRRYLRKIHKIGRVSILVYYLCCFRFPSHRGLFFCSLAVIYSRFNFKVLIVELHGDLEPSTLEMSFCGLNDFSRAVWLCSGHSPLTLLHHNYSRCNSVACLL